jgi:hypothetical protein
MAGRGPQTFKKRQKEQQRKERQEEKRAKRLQRREAAAAGGGEQTDIDADLEQEPGDAEHTEEFASEPQ